MTSTEQPQNPSETTNAPVVFPATFAQQRLWFLDQLQPGNVTYLINWVIRLKGDLDVDALGRTLNEVVRRHQILRTTFTVVDGEVCQVVNEPAGIALPVVHLSAHRDPEAEVRRLVALEASIPIDLANGPVLRGSLLELGSREHVLLLTLHHIFFDGSSRAVFIRDFSAIYEAFRSGLPSPLSEPKLQYANFAAWQHRSVKGKRYQKLLAYWKKQLADAPAVLELPTDHLRPVVETSRGATKAFELPVDLSVALTALARRHNASLFMTVLTAFECLLARYSGQDDIVVGVPVAGRTREELEGMIGLLANELAIRLQIPAGATFEQLLVKMRETALDAYEHEDMPLDRLILEINPERSASHNPLFQVLFSMRNYQTEKLQLAGLEQADFTTGAAQTSKFDLSLFVTERDNRLSGWFEYSTDLFDEPTIARMTGHFENLLRAIVTNPAAPVADLSLLSDAERHKILEEFNSNRVAFPAGLCLHDFVARQADATPDAVAVISGTERVTYRTLNARANRIAHYLARHGAGPDVLIGIYCERNPDLLAGILGILKSGSAYVPLDPNYPKQRLQYILEDAHAPVVLTTQSLAGDLPGFNGRAICLDTEWPEIANESDENPTTEVTPANLAYVLFTSGSTGRPKGVALEHRSGATFLHWAKGAFTPDELAGVLLSTSVCFDLSVYEIFVPLSTGGKVVIAENALYLPSLPCRGEVTLINTVPSAMAELVRSGGVPASVRVVNLAGEALPDVLVEQIYANISVEKVYNLYGPTEDTTYSTWTLVPRGTPVTIGRPLVNTQAYVLDARLQPQPIGIPGELFLAGEGLARGYYGRPDLTEERFLPDPFSGDAGARMYRTGDLTKFLPDGDLQYLGRLDHQVKLRGFRIEMGEIESALDSHPGVRQSVVVVREDQPGDKRLVAYVVSNPDSQEEDGPQTGEVLNHEQVSQWEMAFDEAYRRGGGANDATFNIAGWNSSYTGEPIPPAEMRSWVETTVDRILALRPARVWEIGCGTGLLLFRIAPHCSHFHGTDISQTALDFLQTQLERQNLRDVTLAHRAADEFNIDSEPFDVVVVNSVAQYFPGAAYLDKVIEGAVAAVRPGGTVFIGDVRSLPLLKVFRSSVALFRAAESAVRADLLRHVEREVQQEEELVVDPEFFMALRNRLPRIGRVEIQLKCGGIRNEMTLFRYDVLLHVGEPAVQREVQWLDWTRAGLTLDRVREILRESPGETLGITRVPDARLWHPAAALRLLETENGPETAGDIRAAVDKHDNAVETDVFRTLEREFGRCVEIRNSRAAVDGYCDVLLRTAHDRSTVRFPGEASLVRPWESYASNPLRRRISDDLIPQLRAWVTEKLPEYMVPAAFVLLDAMPLSSNGKVNRRALPPPEYVRDESVAYVAPRTPAEERLAEIWTELLHVRVGIDDDFFALGGHSLLTTQVVSRIRAVFGLEIPLRTMFECPVLAALASRIESLLAEEGRAEPVALTPVPRGERLPLSFAQQRLWFLDQLEPMNPLYNVTSALRFQGELHVAPLAAALNEIARRQDSLRTRFALIAGEPVQIVEEQGNLELVRAEARTEEAAAERIRAEARKPFVLTSAPLFRALLIQLAEDDHILAIVSHHIVSDGWSFGVLATELSAIYEAFVQGRPSPLPELPVQYVDFAAWQRGHLDAERLDRQIAFWKAELEGAPAVLELPTDRPRPAVETFPGARHTVHLPCELLEKLQALSRAENVTLFMTLLGAFGALLSHYSGQDEIVIGSPIAGRPDPQLEKLIGLFLNTIVLRTRLEGDPTFRELLGRVRKTAMAAYTNQDLPFEKLIEAIAPVRDLSRNPLFQAMLILQNMPALEKWFGAAKATPFAVNNPTSKFDLTLLISDAGTGLRATLEYNTDLFDAATMTRMMRHFENLLEAAVAHPERRLSELPLISAGERNQLLFGFNATAQDYPRNRCLHHLVASQAAATPDRVAVTTGDRSLTYRELNSRASQLAHGLIAQGAGPDVLIGIRMSRGIDMLVGLLGILKSGSAYVPLDPSFPADRIAYILEDSAASIVLTDDMFTEAGWQQFAGFPTGEPSTQESPENLAYVLHTSGSTGRPKGVQITHRNLVNFVISMRREPGFAADDTLLAVTTISFDIAGLELYLPLLSGGKIVIASRDEAGDGAQLLRMIDRHAVTVMQATPATWRMMIQAGWKGNPQLKVLCGGEAMPPELAEQLLPRSAELWNMYGPTETTIWSSVYRLQSVPAGTAPLGKPIANTTMYVLDSHMQPVPIGVAGELYIGGDGVARGYLNRPDLTEERFLTDPFLPGARIYKTGDVAKLLPSGDIQYLGRADFQVKVRGFRIELGEVETVLAQHPAVRECVVAAADERLIGYVISSTASAFPAADLRAWVKERLPEYMVPAVFVELASFPLTPNGKVDRKALPAPDAPARQDKEFVAPATPAEDIVARIWAHVLKLDRVSTTDNFFELGGHSLLATQAVSRIREAFSVELPMRALFEAPTVAGLAERLAALERQPEERAATIPLRRVEGEGPWPLSFAQQRLWFLDQLEPLDSSYNVPYIRSLHGALDAARLQFALGEITRRHEVLRTRFTTLNGQPVQSVDTWTLPELKVVDAESEDAARAAALQEARTPFHLETGPLLRAVLIRIAPEDHVLIINTHHTVSDGWSLGIVARELSAFYNGAASPEPLPLRYTDYAVWQREYLSGDRLQRELDWWTAELDGAPRAIELPADRPRPPLVTTNGAKHVLVLPPALGEEVHALSGAEGVTLFMTLLAAFSGLLSRYSRQEDVVIGSAIAGRDRTEIENMVGVFINTLALRVRVAGNPTFRDLLATARDTAMGAYAHQSLPFEKLVEAIEPDRDMSRHPLFQVMFILQNLPPLEQPLRDLAISPFATSNNTSKFDLLLVVSEHAKSLRLGFEYNTDLFDASTIERMAAHFQTLLEAVVADPLQSIGQIPLLSPEEQRRVLTEWNASSRDCSPDRCLHQSFENQAALTPDSVALIFAEQRLTYRELNEHANRIAHHLIGKGVGPDALVALFTERTPAMLAGILGILKSGAAYVPLDPRYPTQRLGYIIEDARAPIVLTQKSLLGVLPAITGQAICLDDETTGIRNEPGENPEVPVGLGNLAYVLFTSGSTGRPKGVAIGHRSASTFVNWAKSVYSPAQLSGVLLSTSICFDLSIFEIFVTLSAGGKIVLAENALELPSLPARNEVTLINTVPSAIAELVRMQGIPDSVQVVNLAGEALPDILVERVYSGSRVAEVYNLYGPTEDTTYSTYTLVPRGTAVTIGRPLSNTQAYILDAWLKPVMIGVPGELYLAGDGLAHGYYGRPDLTAERFIPDPFSADPEARMYRTGDLCRWLVDGRIQYLGRMDHQVKLRGFRIELGEIEAAILQHPSARECVVIVREDVPGDPRLTAYFVPRDGERVSDKELRALVLQRLPEYMVPAAFVQLDKMPLSPNGKISRQALPAPEASSDETYVSARTPTEEMIAGIWADVLQAGAVGVTTNFFHAGGHSLSATQVISRIRKAFQIDLPLRTIFEAPTVAMLAEVVERNQKSAQDVAPPIIPVSGNAPRPLSFAQQRLWILDRIDPDNALYNLPVAIRMAGSLGIEALREALSGIVARHEILRTTYAEVEDRAVQIVNTGSAFSVPLIDLTAVPADDREREAHRICQAEASRPFTLVKDMMLRAILLKLDEQDHILFLNMHHIATDGWSLAILRRELADLYEAALAGQPSPLVPLPIQYADYAVWQREWLQGDVLADQLHYWRNQLRGAPPVLSLPTDKPRPSVQTFSGATHFFVIPKELSERAAAFSRGENSTLFMTLLAAFQSVLLHYSQQTDIVLGTDVAGRSNMQTEALIGFFVNLLVIRTDLSGDPSFRELVGRVREVALGAYAHQDVPFEKLVEELHPERSRTHNPLVQVLFVQNTPRTSASLPGIQWGQFRLETRSKFDMAVFAGEAPEGISVNWVYNPDLFDQATIAKMGELLVAFLDTSVADGSIKLSRLLALAQERDQSSREAERKQFETASLQKLKRIGRKSVSS